MREAIALGPQTGLVRWEYGVLALLYVFALVLRVYRLGVPDMWGDEIYSFQQGLRDFATILKPDSGQFPPFHYLTVHFSTLLLGETTFAGRLPGAILAAGAIPLQYLIGRLLIGRRWGLISAVVLMLSINHIYYSREMHAYAVFLFWGAGSFYFFLRLMLTAGRRIGLWFAYTLFTFGMMWSHYMGAPACLAQAIVVTVVAAAEVFRGRWREAGRMFGSFAAAGVTVGVLLFPYAIHMIGVATGKGWRSPGGSLLLKITPDFLHFFLSLQGFGNGIGLVLFVFLLAAGWAWLLLRSRPLAALLTFWLLFPYALFATVEFGYWTHPRQYCYTLPALGLFCAGGIEALLDLGRRFSRARWWGYAPVGAVVALWAVVMLPSYHAFYSMNSHDDPKSAMAEWMREELPPGSIILYGNYYDLRWVGPGFYHVPDRTFAYAAMWDYKPDYVAVRARDRMKAFLEKYPEAAFYYNDEFGDTLGLWDWPDEFFARRKDFFNMGGLLLAARGLYPREFLEEIDLSSPDLYRCRTWARSIYYNTENDLIERARKRGERTLRRVVDGFGFVMTRDMRPWLTISAAGRVAVYQLDEGSAEVTLHARLAALSEGRMRIVSFGGEPLGEWDLAREQIRDYRIEIKDLPPGRTDLFLVFDPAPGGQPQPVLVDNIWVE